VKGATMYALIIVIGVVSSGVTPVGATSQIVGKFENMELCKKAATEPMAAGTISDLEFSRGIYWYCIYTSAR
jgi:hypothetical protein